MKLPAPITVLLAEDHAIVRQGLRALLLANAQFVVVAEARNGREAVELALTHHPQVILMDIAMPELNGVEATRQILAARPAARILILSAHSEDAYVEKLCALGVCGFMEKQSSAEILAKAIQEVAAGRTFFGPAITRRLRAAQQQTMDRQGQPSAEPLHLTSREEEVLQLVAEGSANKQVAATLGISIKTVEKHRQALMNKLNIHDTAGLTRYAVKAGVIECTLSKTVL